MAKNPITVLAEGNKLLDELSKKLIGVNTNLVEISKSARGSNLKDYFSAQAPSDVNEKLKLQKTIIAQLNAEVKERDRLEKALSNQLAKNKLVESDLNKELVKQRFETQERNKQIKASVILSSKLSTEYQKLVVRMNQAGRAKQNLVAKQAQGINLSNKEQKELKQSSLDFKRYQKAVLKADASIGRFQRNVGNYGSALGKAGLALRGFAGAFGVLSSGAIALGIFNLTKEIDGLDKALKQVTETQGGFMQAQSFIKSLAEESGVEINGLQRAYTKFFAAAKTTNLTLEETQDIFRQTAKAGAILGLSTDDINGSMRALEQILSKGKVQAEEIRGQLGERLPGAFQILAKSMGLTTSELSKQLELGNVLSEEVLPGFARELEKTYSLDKVDKVDTLTAAQNRLSNQWTELIRIIGSGEGVLSSFLKVALDGTNDLLSRFNELAKSEGFLDFIKRIGQSMTVYGNELNKAESEGRKFQKQFVEMRKEIIKLLGEEGKEGRLNNQEYFDMKAKILTYTYEELEAELKRIKAVEKGSKTDEESRKIKNKGIKAIKGSIAYLEQEIKLLEDKRQKLATNSTEYKQYSDAIDGANASLSRLKDSLSGVSMELADVGLGEGFDDFDTKKAVESYEKYKKELEEKKSIQGVGAKGLPDDMADLREKLEEAQDIELEIARETADLKKQLEQDLADSIVDITGSIFDAKIMRYEEDIQKNNDYYANLLDNENLSEEQRDALEAERERKNAQLEKKKRETQRKAAIFNKIAALAEIAIDTAKKVAFISAQAAVLAANPLTAALAPLALAQIPLVIGSGALAAGAIAAKPIPQYKDGKKQGQGQDGIALLNDGGKDELKISKDGSIERITGRNVLAPVLKSDTIIPDAQKFLSNLSDKELYDNLHKHSIISSMAHQNDTLNAYLIAQNIDKSFEKHSNKMVSAMKANRPKININNNQSIAEDLAFQLKLSQL